MSLKTLRVGIVADLLSERWPSMDLVADMLVAHLARVRHDPALDAELLRPTLTERGSGIGRFVRRFWDYPQWLGRRAGAFDVFHVIDHSYAHVVHNLPADCTVVTCHDADAFLPLVAPQFTRSRLPKLLVRRVLSGMQKAALVTCPSAATRDDLLRYDLIDQDRLLVVPNGVHPEFSPVADPAADHAIDDMVGAQADAIDLLHVGTCIPRKRIDRLLNIVAAVRAREPRVRLLKAGGDLTQAQRDLAERLNIADCIVSLPFLQTSQLAALYRRAAVVLMPSEREGFGLPLVEAMACGTSAVAADLPVFHEVGGNAVNICSLSDTQAWTDQVLRLISERRDPATRAVLRSKNLSQSSRFSWQTYADTMANAYERLAPGIAAEP